MVHTNLSFEGSKYQKSDFLQIDGVKGAPCHFFNDDGSWHKRDGHGHETIFWFAQYLLYGKTEDGRGLKTDLYKNIYRLEGRLSPVEKKAEAENILRGIKALGEIPATYDDENGGYFWIEDQDLAELSASGKFLKDFEDFQDPVYTIYL